jgi:Mg2+ and Co2+ transporter CorA
MNVNTTHTTLAGCENHPETVELLREIRDELREFNKDMDRLNVLTEEQVVSTVQNRKVAAITLMFVIPSTFAAIPGANFVHLDEYGFDNFYALPVLVGAVAVAALATFGFVKRKGWL